MAATIDSVPETEAKPLLPKLVGNPETALPDEIARQIGDNKNVPWYRKELGKIDQVALDVLENYSKIPSEDITPHILELRDRAWAVWPYPCIGTFLFLGLSIAESPSYPRVIPRLQNGEKFLDVSCCFDQDIRKLVYDGGPSENLWGTDLEAGFIELGYDLFLDKEALQAHFIAADVLDPDSGLNQIEGQINIIYAGFFFHLFDFQQGVAIAERLIRIMKPENGSLILGKQAGCTVADERIIDLKSAGKLWRHNPASFSKLWEEAGQRTGTKWRINAWLENDGGAREAWVKLNREWLSFEIEREE